ncbi:MULTISPECIES: HpcH/HpaI aldolase/citrate lyase family protein [Gordonia]|uniref:HpcH/HpaI aldolase/citrate lyase family protein n=1 Tax=Gordonia amicalis TaxID=89053 RepID=A0ABU4DBW5_9ACTN|nr:MULTISPECIES: HpcH/HpaI aldolase/citrate lyase family protein [Gordonia]ATD72690.1 ATP/GTP-binding protein [Gordonia sp. 1D]MBA5846735.1 HpcH/HpaI aldolase/citrate lyase family protein [Gordonia amicalis]MDV6307215.1 HpcH/HpaI aldolase/citrate lyase family protein [Gordonia amicalis]MDV7100029.1 HpcH/HpaI aldolase/citrate lyase family protein [Gordonia amicalis]MDV7172428.1 HpcH/HpaI aldolase/citrate lyase family protein [Gordonia amicalis]
MTTTARHDDTGLEPGTIRHFDHLGFATREQLFFRQPEPIDDTWPAQRLAIALGATLYVPATRPDLADVIRKRRAEGVISMVIDLEDAIADHEEDDAIEHTVAALRDIAEKPGDPMLLFVRPRSADRIPRIAAALDTPSAPNTPPALAGFVIPKFNSANADEALGEVARASELLGRHLWVMPVLESAAVVHRETRDDELTALTAHLSEHRANVLAVRIGATDICGYFGIRRDRDLTIYDVRVAADVIAGIVNHLGRSDESGFIVTGPVWEYFADHERMFQPTLRHTPFRESDAVYFRQQLVSRDMDGLLREITLDRANGLHGKTVIHPAHVAAVHALSAVTHEEYHDALDILAGDAGGVRASSYRNKMNELKPHRNWALRVIDRAAAFGVTRQGVSFVDLLTALADPGPAGRRTATQ